MDTIKRHPTIAFFLLTYAFSWTLWGTCTRAYQGGNVFALPGIMFGIFGPGLISVLLSAAVEPGSRVGRQARGIVSFAFVVTWVVATALITFDQILNEGRSEVVPAVLASAAAALAPALVVASVFSTVPGVKRHLHTLVVPRGPAGYYLLALVLFIGIWTLGSALTRTLGLQVPVRTYPHAATRIGLVGAVALTFLYTALPNALSEEVGWRGFALPRLQARHSPLVASIILWVFWALWHAPAYLGGFEARSVEETVVEWALMLPVAIMFTWFYNRAEGSILVTAILHPAMNTATRYLPVTLGGVLLILLITAGAVVRDRMWHLEQRYR